MCADFNLLMRAAADGYGDTIKRNQKAAAAAVSFKVCNNKKSLIARSRIASRLAGSGVKNR